MDREKKDQIIEHLDRIQIKAEQAALESDREQRHRFLLVIAERRKKILKLLMNE